MQENQHQESAISALQKRFKSFPSFSRSEHQILDEANDKELHELALNFMEGRLSSHDEVSLILVNLIYLVVNQKKTKCEKSRTLLLTFYLKLT